MNKLLLFFASVTFGYAQKIDFESKPTQNVAYDLKGWDLVKECRMFPFKIKDKINKEAGGILYSAMPGAMASSGLAANSARLRFDFMLGKNGGIDVIFTPNLSLKLSYEDFGAIEMRESKILPSQNVLRAAGLLQTLDLTFNNGNLDEVLLNKISIHRNVKASNEAIQNLGFKLFSGSAAISQVEFSPFSNESFVQLKNLKFDIQESISWEKFEANSKPTISGPLSELSLEPINNSYKNFIVTYSGKLDVNKQDEYIFSLESAGRIKFVVDGKDLMLPGEFKGGLDGEVAVSLSMGTHDFSISYQKPPWWSSALGFTVRSRNMSKVNLHSKGMLDDKSQAGEISSEPKDQPVIIRSFQYVGNEKKTQVINVGNPSGFHYSLDLDTMQPLYFWKGEYADLTEMWHERGEPQVLEPKGLKILNKTKNSGSNIIFKSYKIEEMGNPLFTFEKEGRSFTQKISPVQDGLQTIITSNDNAMVESVLSDDANLEQVSKDLFRQKDRFIMASKGTKLMLKDGKLIASAIHLISYSTIW